jgi:hypothetical protein
VHVLVQSAVQTGGAAVEHRKPPGREIEKWLRLIHDDRRGGGELCQQSLDEAARTAADVDNSKRSIRSKGDGRQDGVLHGEVSRMDYRRRRVVCGGGA